MTDIVGSTEHASELGDSGWRELVQLHHARIRAALRRHGGREIDTAGDGFFATFDAPAAAVACALDIAAAVKELGIDIRAGVHVGEVEHARTGAVGEPIGVGATPIALAADANGLWVASEDGGSVSYLDPVSGVPRASPIQLNARPSALALDENSVWVALSEGSVARNDQMWVQ